MGGGEGRRVRKEGGGGAERGSADGGGGWGVVYDIRLSVLLRMPYIKRLVQFYPCNPAVSFLSLI